MKNQAPGEPMKLLSELAKELRIRQKACSFDLEEPFAALAHDCWKEAADELQAWLREADKYLEVEEEMCAELKHRPYYSGRAFGCKRFRKVLLGTTRTEGKK